MFKPKYGVRKLPTSRVPREDRLANNTIAQYCRLVGLYKF